MYKLVTNNSSILASRLQFYDTIDIIGQDVVSQGNIITIHTVLKEEAKTGEKMTTDSNEAPANEVTSMNVANDDDNDTLATALIMISRNCYYYLKLYWNGQLNVNNTNKITKIVDFLLSCINHASMFVTKAMPGNTNCSKKTFCVNQNVDSKMKRDKIQTDKKKAKINPTKQQHQNKRKKTKQKLRYKKGGTALLGATFLIM